MKSPGFFAPVMGMLQGRAAIVLVLSLAVIHVGIAWFLYRLFNVLSPDVRRAWSASIETAVEESNHLVVDMTQRLDNLALGTQGFAGAMHHVATASEEQSDSIDKIAGAATSLSSAARRVARLVGTFKLGDTPARGMPAVQSP